MKVKIHCRTCKSESQLTAKRIMSLVEAKEVLLSIQEVLERHRSHPEFLDVTVFEKEDTIVDVETTKQYIYDALKNRIAKHERK